MLLDTDKKFCEKKSATIKVQKLCMNFIMLFPELYLQHNMQIHLTMYFTIHAAYVTAVQQK